MAVSMRKYSAELPWIIVNDAGPYGPEIGCQLCGAIESGPYVNAQIFAAGHEHHERFEAAGRGLGDVVGAIARPIARLLGIDPDCAPCEARRRALNQATPRFLRRR
jgi:hypothetical protein